MAYAGRIGQNDGVRVYISRDENLKIRPTIKICYYAWNDRTMSNPGYGTKNLTIDAYFSPHSPGDYIKVQLAHIPGSGSGDTGLKDGEMLACGKIVSQTAINQGKDHRWNTVVVELNDNIREKFNHTVTLLKYEADVNDQGWSKDVIGIVIED